MALDRMKTALDRLDEALGRLDRAVDGHLERQAASAHATLDMHAFELQSMEAMVAQARDGEREARAKLAELSGRLDGAIDRLRVVLEE